MLALRALFSMTPALYCTVGAVSVYAHIGSLQKVQGHWAGVNADLTPSTGGPVGHACR